MVKYQKFLKKRLGKPELDRILYAISDPTRRLILDHLYRGPKTIGELAEPFKMTLPAISKHIKILRETELISTQRHGRQVVCTLKDESLVRVSTWLARYQELWRKRLEAMKAAIATQTFEGGQNAPQGSADELKDI